MRFPLIGDNIAICFSCDIVSFCHPQTGHIRSMECQVVWLAHQEEWV